MNKYFYKIPRKTVRQYWNIRNMLARSIMKKRKKVRKIYVSKLGKQSFEIARITGIQIEKHGNNRVLCVKENYRDIMFLRGTLEQEHLLIEEWLNISRAWENYKEFY